MRTLCWIVVVASAALAIATPTPASAADDEITVRLPGVVSAPAGVRALVRIPRDPDNRLLRVTLDSGTFYRSSDVPLEGAGAPQSHTLTWVALPPGDYEVTVELVGTARVRQVVRRRFRVIGLG